MPKLYLVTKREVLEQSREMRLINLFRSPRFLFVVAVIVFLEMIVLAKLGAGIEVEGIVENGFDESGNVVFLEVVFQGDFESGNFLPWSVICDDVHWPCGGQFSE